MNKNNTAKNIENTIKVLENNPRLTIHYVDGLCGSGKTHSLSRYISQQWDHGSKYMIITPSKKLADQIYSQLKQSAEIQNISLIHSDNSTQVVLDIMDTIKEINLMGNGIIICTQQVFPRIPFIEHKKSWTLIVDEIPNIDDYYNPSLPYNYNLVTQHLEIDEEITPTLYRLKLKATQLDPNPDPDAQNIKAFTGDKTAQASARLFVNRSDDSIDAIFKPILQHMLQHHECFTNKEHWDRIVINQKVTSDKSVDMTYGNASNKLYFLTLLEPEVFSGFDKVIMMGANFEQSLLFKYWHDYKHVQFEVCNPIKNQLRYDCYKNGHRLTITYFQEETWSKYSGHKLIDDVTREAYYARRVHEEMQDLPYVYMSNKDSVIDFLTGTQIPVISHGINDYMDIDNIYFAPALNRQPMHIAMLNALGIDSVYITRASAHEIAHQGIMRTSMRDPDATKPVNAFVPDRATAEELARQFPNCSIKAIDGAIKKVKAVSNVDRKAKCRLNKLIAHLELNSTLQTAVNEVGLASDLAVKLDAKIESNLDTVSGEMVTNFIINEKCNQNPLNPISPLNETIEVSITGSFNDPIIKSYPILVTDLIVFLKKYWTNNIITHKDKNKLFNTTSFTGESSRTLEDVAYASCVILDIDQGDLSPETFKSIFKEHHKHSMIMMNSFSRTQEQPNHYRALFFLKEKVSDDTYRLVHQYLQKIIADQGYITATKQQKDKILAKNPDAKFSGIDLSKTHTASLFYLPCKVEGHKESAFFWRCNVNDKAELLRYVIDPAKVLQYYREITELPEITYESDADSDAMSMSLDEIKSILLSGEYRHLGVHDLYGRLARAMFAAGFTEADFIEVTPFVSKSKTTKQAKDYWKKWSKYTKIGRGTLMHMIGK